MACHPSPWSLPWTCLHNTNRQEPPSGGTGTGIRNRSEGIGNLTVSKHWGFGLIQTTSFPKEGQGDLPNPLEEQKEGAFWWWVQSGMTGNSQEPIGSGRPPDSGWRSRCLEATLLTLGQSLGLLSWRTAGLTPLLLGAFSMLAAATAARATL